MEDEKEILDDMVRGWREEGAPTILNLEEAIRFSRRSEKVIRR